MIELLAPAGGQEALVAAVQNGADAVYLGLGAFNARAGAHNFTEEEFRAAVRYCHLRGVRVYLTLNTLLTDRELSAAADCARLASDAGADAILIQDWGVYAMLRAVAPDVPLHASTQMSLHTLSGVREAAALGMTRAVLARELSGEEIAEICRESPIEIETFVHGALCMCYSGQCEMSAVIGGRSGNRGQCAQPCRLPYGFSGKADGYPLSLRDASLASHLRALRECGVASLKLEGRMKRPEYVAAVTGIYARLLREDRAPTRQEEKDLAAAFSRDGFTDGYYRGERGRAMFGTRSENARWPEEWFAELRQAYEKETMRTVPVRFAAQIAPDQPMTLTLTDGDGHTVCASGAVPETARSRALTVQEADERLRKTGGTAFVMTEGTVSLADGLAVSASALNALRREALAALEEARCVLPARRSGTFSLPAAIPNRKEPPELTVSLARAEQMSAALAALHPAIVYLPIEELSRLDLAAYPETAFCAVLPRVYRTREETELRARLTALRERGVVQAALGNLGHFPIAEGLGLTLRGDYALNLYNSPALALMRDKGLSSATLSFELRREQIRDLAKCLPCEAIVYGRLPLMITENCIVENALGHVCGEMPRLTDRRGERFPVLKAWGCRSEIENAKTLFLADRPDYRNIGLAYARLRFTTETADECVTVLRAYRGESDFVPDDLTRGLFLRGVE